MSTIKFNVPIGFFGKSSNDSALDSMLREISTHFGGCEKYGLNYENKVFSMHMFCWCENEDCQYCRAENPAPNFHHKKSGYMVWWYKYIGRDVRSNKEIYLSDLEAIYKEIMESRPTTVEPDTTKETI